MSDYGRDPSFGLFVEPLADPPDSAAKIVRAADRAGLDLVGIQDHPYQPRYLDTWTLISTLVPQTERVGFFPAVANLPLRPPAMLAKAAASLDVISGGRVEVGLGAGGFWDAIGGMGGPLRSPGEALRATEEAMEVMRLLWGGGRSARFEGEFYSLRGARPGPTPAHGIGLWLGAVGPKMLALTGRLADGWFPTSPYVPPEALPEKQARIDEAALEAGRDPEEVRRVYGVAGRIGPKENGPLDGPPALWVEELARHVLELGMDSFVFWPREEPLGQLELFAHEVAPAVREAVGKERGGTRTVTPPVAVLANEKGEA